MQGKILIIERDPEIRRQVETLLAGKGEVASCAEESGAPRDFAAGKADVLLYGVGVDCGVGGGLSFPRRGLRKPTIIMADSSCTDAALAEGFPGAFAFLRKPLSPARLKAVVGHALHAWRLAQNEDDAMEDKARADAYVQALLACHSEAAAVLDSSGVIVAINDAGLAELGKERFQVVGKDLVPLLPTSLGGKVAPALESVFRDAKVEIAQSRRSGSEVEIVVTPIQMAGEMIGALVRRVDITTQSFSDQELAENEQRYRKVFQAARDATLLVERASGNVIDSNQAARTLYGYSSDEMERLNLIRDLSAEPDRGLEVLGGEGGRLPIRQHRRKDGTVFPAEASMKSFSVGGKPVAAIFVRDITSRKVVEEALREGARLYRAVVEDQTELICRYRPDGVLTFVNKACAKFYGENESSLVGKSFKPMIADEWARNRLFQWIENATPDDPSCELEQKNRVAEGQERWVRWTNRAIFDHRGKLREFQAVGRDVTESRKVAEDLRLANEEKERFRLNLEATFRSIPDAIITVDARMKVIATNSAATELCELRSTDSRGKDLGELMASEPNPCVSVLKQVLRTRRQVRGFQAELVLEGGERMVELNCSPLLDESGDFIGAVLVVKDVSRIADLEKRLQERHGFRGIVGKSECMQDVYRLLEQLAPLDATVLICGESGTGKELAADALHYGGSRSSGQMVKVNCSALSESLLESELFGHVKGAFTGAVRDKVGRIGAAEKGTLFLDEIADISPLTQLKLLRFLEQKEYERVGESVTRKADVRIIAATNVDLRKKVEEGSFREDLFYRLNVMPVNLPPLREREGDIPLLVDHFLKEFSQSFKKSLEGVSSEVMDLLLRYDWPGNVRELKHLLEHACILCPEGIIPVRYIRPDVLQTMREPKSKRLAVPVKPATSAQDIVEALEMAGGNKSKASDMLGIHRATLYRKMKSLGLTE